MAFQQVTANNQVGFQAVQQAALAHNSHGIYHAANATSDDTLGLVLSPMTQGKLRVVVRADGAYGVAETLVLSLVHLNAAGVEVVTALGTLNITTVAAAGEITLKDAVDITAIPVGAVVFLRRVYTAGTPSDPAVAVTVQLY